MTERIDHVAEAAKHEHASWAQVHATLALVEQQRIANLIAMAVAIRGDLKLSATTAEMTDWLNDGGGVLGYFTEAEKTELGVE